VLAFKGPPRCMKRRRKARLIAGVASSDIDFLTSVVKN
jgi:hypothetical protein